MIHIVIRIIKIKYSRMISFLNFKVAKEVREVKLIRESVESKQPAKRGRKPISSLKLLRLRTLIKETN